MLQRQVKTCKPDLDAVKARQQAAWSSGDYAIVGTTLQIVGEELCEALDIRSDQKVLDVAAGNGNASLAAARRWCDVVATDYVPKLLDRARERADAERLSIEFREADAEHLPFSDDSFDVVVSSFGVMFTPDQDRAAAEMVRVCKSGGKIGLANWTPEGFIGQVFKTIGKTCTAAHRRQVASAVGNTRTHDRVVRAACVVDQVRAETFRVSLSLARHWLDVFRTYYGPLLKTFAALAPPAQAALEQRSHEPDRTIQSLGRWLDGGARASTSRS